jgi:hypothetical protein
MSRRFPSNEIDDQGGGDEEASFGLAPPFVVYFAIADDSVSASASGWRLATKKIGARGVFSWRASIKCHL